MWPPMWPHRRPGEVIGALLAVSFAVVLSAGVPFALPLRFLAAPPVAQAAGLTYYVSTTGSDGNPCTRSAPCATTRHATGLAQPGDTVVVLPGTYLMPPGATDFFVIEATGTPTQPIIVTAEGSVTLIRALSSDPTSQEYSLMHILNSAYLVVAGFRVIGARNQSDYNHAYMPPNGEVQSQHSDHITYRNMWVQDANNTCLKDQDGMPYISVIDSTVLNCGNPYPGPVQQGGNAMTNDPDLDHGIYLPGPYALVEGSTFAGSTGYDIGLHSGTSTGRYDQILDNSVTGATGFGIIADSGYALIQGNTVYANNGCMSLYDATMVAQNICALNARATLAVNPGAAVSILNNTFFDNTAGAIANGGGVGTYYTAPITAENNIFYASRGTGYIFNTPFRGTKPLVAYNDYYHFALTDPGVTPDYESPHSLMADPQFVYPGALPIPDLHLRSTSPAIGAGIPVGLPYSGKAPDLGALCYYCPGTPTTTPTSTASPTTTPTSTASPTTIPTSTATPTATAMPTASPTTAPSPSSPTSTSTAQPPSSTATAPPHASARTTPSPAGRHRHRFAAPARARQRARYTARVPLILSLSAHIPSGGDILTLRCRTRTGAHISAVLEVVARHALALGKGRVRSRAGRARVLYRATLHGTADRYGRFGGQMRIAYRPLRPTTALLIVTVRTPVGTTTRSVQVVLQPRRTQRYHRYHRP